MKQVEPAPVEHNLECYGLTPDLVGMFTLSVPASASSARQLREDVAWFEPGAAVYQLAGLDTVEVKLRDGEVALAALAGLRYVRVLCNVL